ncbi:MAG: hypothetical protein ACREQF_01000 [Candidatus Binataceae bacterium]
MRWDVIDEALLMDELPGTIPYAPVRICMEPCPCGCGGEVPVFAVVGLN